jgi:protein-S-isoprenylcysteine O-methyltransferase Ste14
MEHTGYATPVGRLRVATRIRPAYGWVMALLLRNLLFTLVVPATVGIYVPLWLARDTPRSPGVVLAVALVPFAIATGMYSWSVWNFAVRGRGTPLPVDAPQRLVIQGPYRYTRNPMYLALFSALLG